MLVMVFLMVFTMVLTCSYHALLFFPMVFAMENQWVSSSFIATSRNFEASSFEAAPAELLEPIRVPRTIGESRGVSGG